MEARCRRVRKLRRVRPTVESDHSHFEARFHLGTGRFLFLEGSPIKLEGDVLRDT